jgi:hypothetical protein
VPIVVASAALSDEELLEAFDACTLPLSSFRHGDHLRLAWLRLEREDLPTVVRSVREGIRRFAQHHGVSHIFHATMTEAWVRLLASHEPESFVSFVARDAAPLERVRLETYYSPELLKSDLARAQWVEPDRAPLPPSVR